LLLRVGGILLVGFTLFLGFIHFGLFVSAEFLVPQHFLLVVVEAHIVKVQVFNSIILQNVVL
jgi:hypothetical protein